MNFYVGLIDYTLTILVMHITYWFYTKNSSHLLHDIIYANVSEISCLHPVAYTL